MKASREVLRTRHFNSEEHDSPLASVSIGGKRRLDIILIVNYNSYSYY